MMKKMDKKAFTLIEVIVVVAVIGILVLLAVPRFIGHSQRAELARIQHDVKMMERELGAELINKDDNFNDWGNNRKDLNQLVQDDGLFEKEGIAEDVESIDETYKVIPKEYKGKINTKLKGTFYANSHGKVYYEHGQEPGYSDEEIEDKIKQGLIPVATAEDLDSVRSTKKRIYAAGTKWATKEKVEGGLDKQYIQVKDIDLSEYSEREEGWEPIGSYTNWSNKNPFKGSFDGNGHKITGLTINRPETDKVGLFMYTKEATISNVALEDVNVTGLGYVGGLVGLATDKTNISNSYTTGSVTGTGTSVGASVGGLVGSASTDGTGNGNTINNSYSTGSVKGGSRVGGLVGTADMTNISNSYATGPVEGTRLGTQVGGLVGNTGYGTIENSYATGPVTGYYSVGGLAGRTESYTTISNSYAKGEVNGEGNEVGGLVGHAFKGAIENSYAIGKVNGSRYVGGLVGKADDTSTIINSYAKGSVTGSSNVGGLVGWSKSRIIENSYATGSVTGSSNVGGLVGEVGWTRISNSYATGEVNGEGDYVGGLLGYAPNVFAPNIPVTNSYWNKDTTRQEKSAGEGEGKSEGKTTDEMKEANTYSAWNNDVWNIVNGEYPTLR